MQQYLAAILENGKGQTEVGRGEQSGRLVWPFDQADVVTIELVTETSLFPLRCIAETI